MSLDQVPNTTKQFNPRNSSIPEWLHVLRSTKRRRVQTWPACTRASYWRTPSKKTLINPRRAGFINFLWLLAVCATVRIVFIRLQLPAQVKRPEDTYIITINGIERKLVQFNARAHTHTQALTELYFLFYRFERTHKK